MKNTLSRADRKSALGTIIATLLFAVLFTISIIGAQNSQTPKAQAVYYYKEPIIQAQ